MVIVCSKDGYLKAARGPIFKILKTSELESKKKRFLNK